MKSNFGLGTFSALIIDDCESSTELMRIIFEDTGLFKTIVTANDGVIGGQKLLNQNFDFIILELNLPKKNGINIINEVIRDGQKEILENIIVVAGDISKEGLKELFGLGVKDVILKPFDHEELLTKFKTKIIKKKMNKKLGDL